MRKRNTNFATAPLFPELAVDPDDYRNLPVERLPTNTTTHQHPIHRWFNFIAGFSPEFVHSCCDDVSNNGGTLLDPFAGCATAPLVACQRGMQAIGFEPHPVFLRIGRAKLPGRGAQEHSETVASAIYDGFQDPQPPSALTASPGKFLTKLFSEDTLAALLGARESLRNRGLIDDDLAFLMLSKVLDLSSHSQTDGVYKAPTSRKGASRPADACRATAEMIRSDLTELGHPIYATKARIYAKSAENMALVPDDSVSLVVTSPPYLNNFDYAEMTRMHLYFWEMATSWGDITRKVRSKLIVNTTTALKGHKNKQQDYRAAIPARLHAELVLGGLNARFSGGLGRSRGSGSPRV